MESPCSRQIGSRVEPSGKKRKFLRYPLKAEIELNQGVVGGELAFSSFNASGGGLFLESDLLLEIGDIYWINISLPETEVRIRARGKVVWVNRHPDAGDPTDRPGMGIEFLNLSAAEQAALETFLKEEE